MLCLRIQGLQVIRHSPENCFSFGEEHNILQIFTRRTSHATSWSTYFGDFVLTDVSKIKSLDLTRHLKPYSPIHRLSTQLVRCYLLLTVMRKHNASLYFPQTKNPHLPLIHYGGPLQFQDKLFITLLPEHNAFSFLTCYAMQTVSFEFYVTPFSPEIWYFLATTFLTLVLILWSYLLHKKYRGSFCSWMYVLRALLEDGVPVPGQIERLPAFRWTLGSWLIVSVLLSNCYNGLMITGLNSPLSTKGVETFRDLVCDWKDIKNFEDATDSLFSKGELVSYLQKMPKNTSSNLKEMQLLPKKDCFSLLSLQPTFSSDNQYSSTTKVTYVLPEFFKFLMDFIKVYHWPIRDKPPAAYTLALNLFHWKHGHVPKALEHLGIPSQDYTSLIESEVVGCGKTVFVGKPLEVETELEYLRMSYSWIKFYREKDSLSTVVSGVGIVAAGTSRIVQDFRAFIDSGIYGRLIEQHSRRNYKRKRAVQGERVFRGMTMDENPHVVHHLCWSGWDWTTLFLW